MHVTSSLDFSASPADVAAMMVDKDYLEQVCQASHALQHSTSVDGAKTTMSRTMEAPPAAAKFTGDTITIVEETTWGEPTSDGSRSGQLELTVPGFPVQLTCSVSMRPGGRGTVIDYDGDFSVNIPFVGKKLEQSAAPAITEGIKVQQQVGDRWLA